MAHKPNEDVIKGWDEDDVTQYIEYLHRKGNLKDKDKMETIRDQFDDKEINGTKLWDITKVNDVKAIIGDECDEFKQEAKGIFRHLKQLKKGKFDAPCEFQLESYVPIVDWDPSTLQQYIAAIIDPNGKYHKYMPNFNDISGDILLHKIDNQSSTVLSKEFGINDADILEIWDKIQTIATKDNAETPTVSEVREAFKIVEAKLSKYTPKTASESVRDSADDNDEADEKALGIDRKDKNYTEWSLDEVVTWLCSLRDGKYKRYEKTFRENETEGECLPLLDKDLLKDDYGIRSVAHRHGILEAVEELKQGKPIVSSTQYRNTAEVNNQSTFITGYSASQIMVQNLFIICIAIGEYLAADRENIYDVCRDVANYRNVLGEKYKYKFMSSVEMKGNVGYKMTKTDVETYINECLKELIKGEGIKQTTEYDALLVTFSGHGTIDSIVCSDDQMIKYTTIRGWFRKLAALNQIPRFFCVDACRVDVKDEEEIDDMKQPTEECGLVKRGSTAPSATIMGQIEGNIVQGGQVSKYLCKQWEEQFDVNRYIPNAIYQPFGALYGAAYMQVKNETPQKLTLAEYELEINDVVFKPIDRNRGQLKDGAEHVVDDDLCNILRPYAPGGTKMNLMQYVFKFFNAGVRDNAALSTLTENRLKELKIEMLHFHQIELLQRVHAL
eukprot:262277_1